MLCTMYMQGSLEGQKRASDPWNWNPRWLQATNRGLGIKPAPLQQQSVLLTSERIFNPKTRF